MKIYFAADHAGFFLKGEILEFVKKLGFETVDCGSNILDNNDDFTDYIAPAAEAVSKDPDNSRAVIFGGSGQGEAMLANRFRNVRATVFYGDPSSGLFRKKKANIIDLSRKHNNANVLSIGARFVGAREAKRAVKKWLETPFPGEIRHKRRISKIEEITR